MYSHNKFTSNNNDRRNIYIVRGNIMSCTKDLTMEEMYEWCVCLRIYIPGRSVIKKLY